MAQYKYEALTLGGEKVVGSLESESPKAARAFLRQQGLVPMQVEAAHGSSSMAGSKGKAAFNAAGRSVWTRQLAGLVTSGLTLERALASLSDEMDDPKLASLCAELRSEVQSGSTFAKALGAHPASFGDVYVAVVKASEEAGNMGVAMEKLADQLEEQEALKSKIIGASLYPAIVSVLALCIVIFLVTYVVPQVATVFANSKKALPLLTQIMLGASAAARAYGLWAAGGIALAVLAARQALRADSARIAFDAWWLELPIIGKMSKAYNAAQYGSTLAMLSSSGVPIIKALEAASGTLSNRAMRADAVSIIALVKEGAPLGACLAQKNRFPKLLATFARLGEQTGQLPAMLSKASSQIGADVQRRAMRMATLLEPILIVGMGAMVMLIVMAVLLPIINMSSLAK